ncbi:MAG TPA: EamA family transporter [Gemmatimonadaceae bacterium]
MPESPAHAPRSRVIAAFAAVYVIWGSTYLAIRFAVATIPPFLMAGARFLAAGAVLYAYARARGLTRVSRAELRGAAIVGLFLLLLGNGAVVWAEQSVPSGITALLVATVPVWMVVVDWLRPAGTRPRVGVFAGLGLGLAGIALLVGPGAFTGHAEFSIAATGVLVLGSISWAVGSIYARHAPRPASAITSNAVQMLAGGAALVLVGGIAGEPARLAAAHVTARSLWSLAYLATFGSLIGFTAYTYLLEVSTPARVATYAYVNPIVAVFLGWALASEPVEMRTIAAAAVILAGVAIITLAGTSPRRRG